MFVRSTTLVAALVAASLGAVTLHTSAQAQAVPPGATIVEGPVTAAEARDIAAENGVLAESVEYNNGSGRWEIDGRDQAGRDVQMDIDANSGQVVEMDRD